MLFTCGEYVRDLGKNHRKNNIESDWIGARSFLNKYTAALSSVLSKHFYAKTKVHPLSKVCLFLSCEL